MNHSMLLNSAVLAAALAASAVHAQDTLKKIKDSGTASMGVRESSGALAFTLGDGKYTGIAMEYGTVPFERVMDALRPDQWLENHPDAPQTQRTQIKRQIRDAFYTDTDSWKKRIVEQGVEAAHQAVAA